MKRLLNFLLLLTISISACQSSDTPKATYADLISNIRSNDFKSFKEGIIAKTNLDTLIQDSAEKSSYTLLGYACKYQRPDFLKALLSRKVNINLAKADEIYEYDALYVAIEAENVAAVRMLLESGADANTRYTEDGLTPLGLARNLNNIEIIKVLTAKKATVQINEPISASGIKNVSFQKADYSLSIETESKTYSFENLEFTGYRFSAAKLLKDNTFQISFGHSSGSRLIGTAEFDQVKEALFLTSLQSISYEKNDPEGRLKKCTLKGLKLDFKSVDEDELLNKVFESDCAYAEQ